MKRYTAAELAFAKRGRKMPRRELLRAFRRRFPRRRMTLSRISDLCHRKGWGVGPLKGRKRGSTRYSAKELAFVKRRRRWERTKLHTAFVEKFQRSEVTCNMIKQLCQRNRWLTDPPDRHRRNKGRSLKYSKVELAFLSRRRRLPRRELHARFVRAFPRHRAVSEDAIHALCLLHGWQTGRDGGFEKGHVPANKGKKMPFNANSARTQFKKGCRIGRANQIYKPIGAERFSKEGYLERKVHDGLPLQSRWRSVHVVNWEKVNGPVPKGHCLKCLDGDRLNTDASNWELISRAVLARLNKSGHRYDAAPAELKPAILAIAKLRDRIGARGRHA